MRDGIDGDVLSDLLDLLEDVPEWRATDDDWRDIGELLAAVTDAIGRRDRAALRKAVGDLELASPIRVIRLGEVRRVPPPEPIRERVNRLVHELPKPATEPSPTGNAGGKDTR